MSDRGLGHFPIAGPKNSSSSLELCHAVFFLFGFLLFFVFFLTLGTIKAAQTGALKENRGLASPQMSNHDMISPPLCNQRQSFPPDSWLALLGGYVYSKENQCQYRSNHASLPPCISQCESQHTLTWFSDRVSLTPCSPKHPSDPTEVFTSSPLRSVIFPQIPTHFFYQ